MVWFVLHLRCGLLHPNGRLFRFQNAHIDDALRDYDPPHTAQLAHASRSTHLKRWYPRCTDMANRAGLPRAQLAARAHTSRLRLKHHSSIGGFRLFAPRGARWGLRVPAEMYVLAVYFGALYAEIMPPGEEARWYGLFSITDKVRCVSLSRSEGEY